MINTILHISILIFVSSSFITSSHAESVKSICSIHKLLTKPSTFSDLIPHIKELKKKYPGKPNITKAADNAILSLKPLGSRNIWKTINLFINPRYKSLKSAYKNFKKKMSRLADEINKQVPIRYTGQNPVIKALIRLTSTYPTERSRIKNAGAFFNKVKRIMALSPTGKKVLSCWNRARHPRIIGMEIINYPSSSLDTGMFLLFNVYTDKEVNFYKRAFGKYFVQNAKYIYRKDFRPRNSREMQYRKQIKIKLSLDPLDSFHVFFHEMKHGCQSANLVKSSDRYRTFEYIIQNKYYKCGEKFKNTRPPKHLIDKCIAPAEGDRHAFSGKKKQRRNTAQNKLVDEVRTHWLHLALFKELAKAFPEKYCKEVFVSASFNFQIINFGEYWATYEKALKNGTFASQLSYLYTLPGGPFLRKDLLKLNARGKPIKNRHGDYILHPGLERKIRKAGFKIR